MDRSNELLEAPMVEWQKLCEKMSQEDRRETESVLAQLATRAARASAYLSRRETGGRHEDAVKRQNAVARSVRYALGYTYGRDDVSF
jgi:hypothetical protein